MGIFSIFKKKDTSAPTRTGGMEDFMTLVRVYYQAVMAGQLGISNLAALPDLRVFKQTLKVPTVNNRLGLGEKKKCRQMLQEIYALPDSFFATTDSSIKHHCRNMQHMQTYLFSFQGFTQELMMLAGNLMKWKFRVPGFMKKALYTFTQKTINDIMTKDAWKDSGVRKSVANVRRMSHQLGYDEAWMTEFVYHVVILAKKEPKPQDTEPQTK